MFGLFVLTGLFLFLFGGITFFIARLIHPQAYETTRANAIGVLRLQGVIMDADKSIRILTDFRRNSHIKAVVVRIDSPGGAVGASQEIYDEIRRTARVKPVVASMQSVAASGAYYAALGASRIVADPGTITGSIGVIIKFPNLKKIFDRIGYKTEVIKSGINKDIGSMSRNMTPEERQLIQKMIDNVLKQFIRAVAQSRHLTVAKVKKIADGRVFSGEQALELGLLDKLGNFTTAVEMAAKLGGITIKNPPLIYPEDNKFNLLRYFSDMKSQLLESVLWNRMPALMYQTD
ncbi:signal peptide peptidase SppA [Desulfobacterota bacterium M19]